MFPLGVHAIGSFSEYLIARTNFTLVLEFPAVGIYGMLVDYICNVPSIFASTISVSVS